MSDIDTTAPYEYIVPPDHTPEGHRIRARTTWLLARHDYLQGDSAPQVCDRYGLNERTLRDRAKREKWRRIDQPDPDPIDDDEEDAGEPVDCAALADDALLRVRRALKRGRAGEAASWMRLHEKLVRRLAQIDEAERRSRRVDEQRGVLPVPDGHPALDALTAAIELAKTRARKDLDALNAELAEARGETPPVSRPSHPTFFDDEADDLDDEFDLDPP